MGVYSIELPNKNVLDIEAGDEATAVRGAQEWFAANGSAEGQQVAPRRSEEMRDGLVEGADDGVRNFTGALDDVAPKFSALKSDIKAGITSAEMDTSKSITDAVKTIADLRARGVSPATHFAQQDATAASDPIAEQLVRAFHNDDMARPAGREKMRSVLEAYADEAGKHSPNGLLPDATTKGDILNVAKRANPSAEAGEGGAQGVGASVREGGGQVQRPEAATGGAPAGPSGEVAGKAADVKLATTPPAKVTEQEAKLSAIGRAIGIDAKSLDSDTVANRLLEMAGSKLSADVSGLLKMKSILGHESWSDVVHGMTARMGGADNGFSYGKFLTEYRGMTDNGRNVLFSGAGRDGVKQNLDALAERYFGAETSDAAQQVMSRIALSGDHLPLSLRARMVTTPAVVRDTARLVEATVRPQPSGSDKMINLATRNLAASIAKETGDDEREVETKLKGAN